MTKVQLTRDGFWALPLYKAVAGLPASGYQAIGKVVQDVTYEVKNLPNWTLEDWGYGRNKQKQLDRNYWNPGEIDRIKSILARRSTTKYTSVAVSLRGAPKDARSQGWCMLSLVISRYKDWCSVEVQYRTTELILKFAADVWYLREKLLPTLGVEPDLYRFRFANCALSGAYLPYLINKLDLVDFLEFIRQRDKEFFLRTTRFLLKSSYLKNQHHPFSPEKLSHRYLWKHATKAKIEAIRKYLEPLHKATGKPLPKDFHDENYVPKGRRNLEDDDG